MVIQATLNQIVHIVWWVLLCFGWFPGLPSNSLVTVAFAVLSVSIYSHAIFGNTGSRVFSQSQKLTHNFSSISNFPPMMYIQSSFSFDLVSLLEYVDLF